MNPAEGIQTLTPAMARRQFFASGAATERMFRPNFDQFGIARISDFAPLLKTPLPPARSTIPLIMWLTDGQFDIRIGVQLWSLKPGAVVFIAARQIFSIPGILHGSTGYVCMFDEQFLARHTGKSPTVWIDQTAVLEARAMLCQSGLSIGQIAAGLGFDDLSSSGKLFKKYTGQTPGNFRRMIETDEFMLEIT